MSILWTLNVLILDKYIKYFPPFLHKRLIFRKKKILVQ
jgi:hypothetical protein